ncbi:MAG: DUF4329 domain-containing protein [Pseudomonadota bacterium]
MIFLVVSLDARAETWRRLPDPVDRFAASILNKIQAQSIREGVEYCGFIGYNRRGELSATDPKRGSSSNCFPPFFKPWGFDAIASYHTHGSYHPQADTEVPSVRDLESDFDDGIDGYVATPGGRLWVNILREGQTVKLCGRNCLTSDPLFDECAARRPEPTYTLRDLIVREQTDTGAC